MNKKLLAILSCIAVSAFYTVDARATLEAKIANDAQMTAEIETMCNIFNKNMNSEAAILQIPDAEINLPILFENSKNLDKAQKILDMENLGVISKYDKKWLISDHAGQGFDKIEDLKIGSIAILLMGDKQNVYSLENKLVCERKKDVSWEEEPSEAHPNGRELHFHNSTIVDENKVPILFVSNQYNYPLFMQTCIDDKLLMMTCWTAINEEFPLDYIN